MSIAEADDGRALVHCFAGCSVEQVLAALGLRLADLFDRPLGHSVAPAKRRPWTARDAIEVAFVESLIVADVGARLLEHKAVGIADWTRLAQAVGRLARIKEVV